MPTSPPLTAPSAIQENTGRTTAWRPSIHVVEHDGVKPYKGRTVWTADETFPRKTLAVKAAFRAWAEGKGDDKAEEPTVEDDGSITLRPVSVESEGKA